jgi:thiamine biosynthesis lipoprotein
VLVPPHIDATPPALGAVEYTLQGRSMGTTWCVKLCGHRNAALDGLRAGIQQQLDAVVAQMSHWDASSDLGRFNRRAPGTWQTLPAEFFTVLACALAVARASGGACDPTAGALVNLWGFGPVPRLAEAPPADAAIDAARALGGWRDLPLDASLRRVQQPGGWQLDLSAVAKGFGVDQVARHLQARSIDSFLVEVGGELRGEGVKPDGQPWWVALEAPADDTAALGETLIALHGASLATSGDYRRFFHHGGTRYSHTLDPRSGRPIAHGLASVSVLHREAMWADAWSTALNVLGPDDGLTLAEAQGLAAHFVVRTRQGFSCRHSRAWHAWLT